ncbi:uncharacterized protein [Diadema setosum]|uniref:uncharacterized protein n=1 Tax=Diadema setosum TaxID=31175 RepID=UPI003B3AB73E
MDDLKLFRKDEKQCDKLVQTVRLVSKDIGMDFGINKCATLVMKRGRRVKSAGISLPDGRILQSLEEGENYKYLGVLESDDVSSNTIKVSVTKEYFSRVKSVLKSHLNGGHVITALNTWAVAVLRYTGGVVEWTKAELAAMDRKTRKMLSMYKTHQMSAYVDRLYLPRKGGRGLVSASDCVEMEQISLNNYINSSEEKLLPAVLVESGNNVNVIDPLTFKSQKRTERSAKWREKQLHGQFCRETENISSNDTWLWLKKGELKKETEGLVIAAQEQALSTNALKAKIQKRDVDAACRICRERDETVQHIVCGCSKLAQKEYKRRHDKLAQVVHWELCRKHEIPCESKWYMHEPQKVSENGQVKILWDFDVQTDNVIQHRRPDIIVVERAQQMCTIIDVAVPEDSRVAEKEKEKIEKYQDLARELRRLWNMRTKVIPIVVGALGTTPQQLRRHLDDLDDGTNPEKSTGSLRFQDGT